jgi:alpha-L-rhamnosidase
MKPRFCKQIPFRSLPVAAAFLLITCLSNPLAGQAAFSHTPTKSDPLEQGFLNPPNAARPRVWWHWMNGNITEKGIDLDLDWMHRVGIGGFHTFDVSLDTPTIVDRRLIYMTPEWKQAFRHALSKADDLGLEVTIASSPGWSETGGPWVQPAQGMKKLVWSETVVTGGKPLLAVLPSPPTVSGTFQDLGPKAGPRYYADVAVVAYPITRTEALPAVSTNTSGPVSDDVRTALADGHIATSVVALPVAQPGKDAWVQFSYQTPQSMQAIDFAIPSATGARNPDDQSSNAILERSDDGTTFVKVIEFRYGSASLRTVSFPVVTARYFRVRFPPPDPSDSAEVDLTSYSINELRLYAEPRNNDFQAKAGFTIVRDYYALEPAAAAPGTVIPPAAVVDLTSKMSPDGTLNWLPPEGDWRVLRLGYSLTGKTNHPAPPEATGLEVDALSRKDVESYLDHYLVTYVHTVGKEKMGAHGIRFMLTDSVESGPQNWTEEMLTQFHALRGYDAHPWLPALTGAVIEDPQATDQFLWDFRRTIAQLVSSSHYDTIAQVLHARGMGYYGEALEHGRPQLGDDLEMRRSTDIPMGAMWVDDDGAPSLQYSPDLRGAASTAHVYGRNLVGAESLTSAVRAWGFAPEDLKSAADMELALGVNQFMIHESAHQPVIGKVPGLSLGKYGQWFNRNETWAEQAKPWIDYLARCSFMLQQGRFYADVAYFYGEEEPLTVQYAAEQGLPENNGFDFVNSDMILHEFSAAPDGRIHTRGGASYRILYLGGSSRHMTVPVLRQLLALTRAGAVIAGTKPVDSPSLADRPEDFRRLVDELWGTERPAPSRQVGRGRVLLATSATEALQALRIPPDWNFTARDPKAQLVFVHRKLRQGDVYFLANRRNDAEEVEVSFAEVGKVPELWFPDKGERRIVSYSIANGRTSIPLKLAPDGSLFIVFRTAARASSIRIPDLVEESHLTLDGAWNVNFEPDRGAPPQATFNHLVSWSENSNPGIRYFSGHATYQQTVTVPRDWFRGVVAAGQLWLDLGEVKNIAEVTVNGKLAGTLWKTPFRVEVSSLLRPGQNIVTVRVVNLWVNRLIGDLQPGVTKRYTYTASQPYRPDSPLLPSGLLGPVRIIQGKTTGSCPVLDGC